MRDPGDTPWVREAWERARGRRPPGAGLLHQSARGSQSARHADRSLLAASGMAWSIRGLGAGCDQAVAARFCGSAQRERPAPRSSVTRPEAREDVVDDIAMCYHRWRTHAYRG